MKERPFLFSGEMIRALLAGTKTQTRRVMKVQPDHRTTHVSICRDQWMGIGPSGNGVGTAQWDSWQKSPFATGDRLWVRETWGVISHSWDKHGNRVKWTPNRPATAIREMPFGKCYYSGHVIYAANGPNEWSDNDDGGGEPRSLWHPSIHMPRAACRLVLEITDIRAERLQDISEADAEAEGGPVDHPNGTARGWFEQLWEKLYGAGSWDANPWTWVIEFKKVEA